LDSDEEFVIPHPVQARLGVIQLSKLERRISQRRMAVKCYLDQLSSIPPKLLTLPPNCEFLSHFPILSERRDELEQYFIKKNVHCTNVFRELPEDLPLLRKFMDRDIPNARWIRDRCLLLPLYFSLEAKKQFFVSEIIKEWAGETLRN
jgi:dTDP-4-amino-4,6-dideoxygalactose transaminase